MPKGELEVSFTLKMDQKGDLSATAELKLEDGEILSSSLTIDQRNSSMKDDKIDAIKGREEMMIAHSENARHRVLMQEEYRVKYLSKEKSYDEMRGEEEFRTMRE